MNDLAAPRLWVGIDVGKGHHWMCVLNADGDTLWSSKVSNDETDILDAIAHVTALAPEVVWAVDIVGTAAGLLLALLAAHGQQISYVPGRTVNRMAGAYRGEAKTDARDAYVIAETLRHRRDLSVVDARPDLIAELALLVAHRADLIADRVRMINRLRDVLSGYFPALERSFDFAHNRAALTLLTGYQTPAAIRRMGQTRLARWLRNRSARKADEIAATAVEASASQQTTIPGEKIAATIVAENAAALLALDERVSSLEKQIQEVFREHPKAEIIESMPGIGPILGADLLVAAGDLATYTNAGRLASAAGLVPVPRDSGRISGNMHRPTRYSRRLRRVFYLSAQTAIMKAGPNRDFYLKKRGEGLRHTQALIALARRRVDVLWALLRDNRPFTAESPRQAITTA